MALVEHFFAGQDIAADVAEVDGRAGSQYDRRVLPEGQIGGCHHGANVRKSLGLAGIDGQDLGVRVRASQDVALQHAAELDIGPILRFPCYLIVAVMANRSLSDDVVLSARQHDVGYHWRVNLRLGFRVSTGRHCITAPPLRRDAAKCSPTQPCANP